MNQSSENRENSIVIFGGNGFVGSHIAAQLVAQGASVISLSRSGKAPRHLQDTDWEWARHVDWQHGDAGIIDTDQLQGANAVISCIGSPPVPTFSEDAWDRQFFSNGTANINVINAAKTEGIDRVVLIGAHIPKLLDRPSFAYAHGKQKALAAAQAFAESGDSRTAVVLQPSGIYGTRHTAGGKAIPLGLVMGPIAKVQRCLPDALRKILPESLVSVDDVAAAAAAGATDESSYPSGFHLVSNQEIIEHASNQ